jgi:hypothetical protein
MIRPGVWLATEAWLGCERVPTTSVRDLYRARVVAAAAVKKKVVAAGKGFERRKTAKVWRLVRKSGHDWRRVGGTEMSNAT